MMLQDIKVAKKRDFGSVVHQVQSLSKEGKSRLSNKGLKHLDHNNAFSIRQKSFKSRNSNGENTINEADEEEDDDLELRQKTSKYSKKTTQGQEEIIEELEDEDIDATTLSQIDKAKNVIASKQAKLNFEYDHSGVKGEEEDEYEEEEEDVEDEIFRKLDEINKKQENTDKQIEDLLNMFNK